MRTNYLMSMRLFRFENTPPPCGNNHNCSGLPDNRYPDMTPGQECEYFFTCIGGVNHGVTPCNPPNSTGTTITNTAIITITIIVINIDTDKYNRQF